MTRIKLLLALAVLLLVSLACALTPATPTPVTTSPPASDTPSGPTATPGECTVKANSQLTIYNRPSKSAQEFSTQGSGFSTQITARTSDGWYGFDPGVAQAANTGVFRLRWIDSSDDVTLSGDCANQPLEVGPQPNICYEMPMGTVDVHASPDGSSAVTASLQTNDYAAILGKTSAQDWYKLDLAQGNTGLTGTGWISSADLNMNGPSCDSIPVVTP